MDKMIGLFILILSILAIGNAAITYKKSTYFKADARVNLQAIVSDIDQLEKTRLVQLSKQLASISEADNQVLIILRDQFKQAIFFLIICLLMSLLFSLYLILKPYYKRRA